MEIIDELDDLTHDAGVADHRALAKGELDEIAHQAKQALADAGLNIDLFFMLPSSGDSLLIFGTPGDPPHDEWNRVREIVSALVRQSVGLDRVRCRPVVCATTDSIAASPTGASASQPATIPMPAVQRYPDIAHADRFRLPISHPVLAEIVIDAADWYRLQRLGEDNPATRILGHDEPVDGMMTVHLACASDEVRKRLEDGWN